MKKIFATGFILAMTTLACNDASNIPSPQEDSSMTDTGLMDHITTETKTAVVIPGSRDAQLVYDIVEGMHGDIALLQQGYNKTTTASIKIRAKKLETQENQLLEELEVLHTKKAWPLPAGVSVADQEMLGTLGGLDIPSYEKEWRDAVRNRLEGHIKKLQTAKPEDEEVKVAVVNAALKLKEMLTNIKG
jgi:hypothetical protein